ncbi:hypothetical protein H5410_060877, partial [Solanum commersonii]
IVYDDETHMRGGKLEGFRPSYPRIAINQGWTKKLMKVDGKLTALVYTNPYEDSMTHLNENQKDTIQVSAIVTRTGKSLQEITRLENVDAQGVNSNDESPKEMKIKPHFPQRLRKKNDNAKFQKFVEIVKDLKVNIPSVDALTKNLGYAKYMKELVTNKRVIDCETIEMPQTCNAVMTKNTRSIGVVSDELVKTIIGHGQSLVDMEGGELIFPVNDEVVSFNIHKSMKYPSDLLMKLWQVFEMQYCGESLAQVLLHYDQAEISDYDEVVVALVGVGSHTSFQIKLDLNLSSREAPSAKPSIIEPPNLELQ